jgi:transcription initiation factor TFIIIB Brf1 subunit/transcription initiation factor TFIIB
MTLRESAVQCSAVKCRQLKSLELESVKGKVETWCEMNASQGVRQVGAMSQLWDIRQPIRTLAENIVRIRYQETTNKDIEDFMCAAITVIFRRCKPMRLL